MKQEAGAVKGEPGPDAYGGAAAAAAAPTLPVIKKIKLSTGKAGAVAPAAKKPIIKFKPPPKQPRDAVAAAAVGAAAPAAPAALPIVRLTVTAGAGLGGGGGAKRLKAKGGKAKAVGGMVVGKKAKAKAGKAGEAAPRGRPKRPRSEPKDRCAAGRRPSHGQPRCRGRLGRLLRSGTLLGCRLRDAAGRGSAAPLCGPCGRLFAGSCRAGGHRVRPTCSGVGWRGAAPATPAFTAAPAPARPRALTLAASRESDFTDEDEFSGDEFGAALDEPVAPRTFTLRSSHAAAAAAPSSTGLGLSAGGPAPSDARTGASGGAAAMDTAGTEVCGPRRGGS